MDLINFYANKDPKKLPRFFYRTFFSHVKSNNLSFAQALDIFSKSVDNFDHPDFHKFFYNIPDYFKQHFSEIEINKLEMVFNKKSKLQERIKNTIFPHVSDEFSLSSNFFKKCFNSNYPKIFSNDKFFMLGSCFARNFSIYLKRKGHEVEVLNQFEDFNSLGSNAIFLKFANMSNAEIENDVLLYLNNIHDKKHKEKICFEILNSIDNAKKQIKNATKIIFTLGNVIDFYDESNNLLPKFIFMGSSEDVNSRALVAKKMKEFGSVMRISNFSECLNYLNIITSSIRLINQNPSDKKNCLTLNLSSLQPVCIRDLLLKFDLNIEVSDAPDKTKIHSVLNTELAVALGVMPQKKQLADWIGTQRCFEYD